MFFIGEAGEIAPLSGIIGTLGLTFIFTDKVTSFLGIDPKLIPMIAFGSLMGGGIVSLKFEKLGGAISTMGWIAVGMLLLQVIPIPFIATLAELALVPCMILFSPIILLFLLFA